MSTSSTPVPSTTAAKKPLVSMLRTPTDPRRAKIAKQLLAKRGYSTQFKRPLDRLVALDAKLTEFISASAAEIKKREETPGRWAKKGALIGGAIGIPVGISAGVLGANEGMKAHEALAGQKFVGKAADRARLKTRIGAGAVGAGTVGAAYALQGAAIGGIAGLLKRRSQRNDDMRKRLEKLTNGK